MTIAVERDVFANSTPADFHRHGVLSRRASHMSDAARQREMAEGDRSSSWQENHTLVEMHVDFENFQTVKRVLEVLKEGRMDVAGFLNALCWGNRLAITDPITRSARTHLTHSDQLAEVVSRWLHPPRTSQGGSTAEGAKPILLPLMIETVKEVINKEMDAVVEELKEDSVDVTKQSVLGTVIDKVQERVQVVAPVFYDLMKTAAWRKEQEERNKIRDPTKVSTYHELGYNDLPERTFSA